MVYCVMVMNQEKSHCDSLEPTGREIIDFSGQFSATGEQRAWRGHVVAHDGGGGGGGGRA